MNLAPLTQRFVLHFGEMGSRWGINRTVGQIYALLYVSPRALNADDIGEALAFSRSNVSMGLKELQSWNLVRLQHLPNDRREYFQAPEDVWAIFRTLAEERRKREGEERDGGATHGSEVNGLNSVAVGEILQRRRIALP